MKSLISLKKSLFFSFTLTLTAVGCTTTEEPATPENGIGIEGETADASAADEGSDAEMQAADETLLGIPSEELQATGETPAESEEVAEEITTLPEVAPAPETAEETGIDAEALEPAEEPAMDAEAVESEPESEVITDEVEEAPAPVVTEEEEVKEAPNYQLSASPVKSEPIETVSTENSAMDTTAAGPADYIVLPGDTLSAISKKVTGSPSNWKQLAETNGIADPTKIRPGDVIRFSNNDSAKSSDYMAKIPKKNVAASKGDTLAKIAEKVMGNASFWPVIWRLNIASIPNPHRIREGQDLVYFAMATGGSETSTNVAH
ncbi:MAG: LysM peptidoglycan-binding domain-containing protein [Oligoflexales bacterium]